VIEAPIDRVENWRQNSRIPPFVGFPAHSLLQIVIKMMLCDGVNVRKVAVGY